MPDSNWMHENQLYLNVEKTHLMNCGTSQKLSQVNKILKPDVNIDGVLLSESKEAEKILGVNVQPNLKWKKHTQEIQAKLELGLTGLRKIRNILSLQRRKVVAQAIFQSVLTYCIAVWDGTSKGDIQDLQILQNKAAKFVLLGSWRMSRVEMFANLGWMTVHQLVTFHRILAVYTVRKTGEPEYLAEALLKENNRGNIVVPFTGLTLAKKSFIFHGGELWNSVPSEIRTIQSVLKFKNQLKSWILLNVELFL